MFNNKKKKTRSQLYDEAEAAREREAKNTLRMPAEPPAKSPDETVHASSLFFFQGPRGGTTWTLRFTGGGP